ncbi:efflux transporter periplasmic adaptor subunit [Photobacterium proteolyticum]|uniref:Efflux transporter periplasmic adaptor subunit n=1 Tax=Photobacterium proteolyticum TaxID=1903952 RepID=A0A1Q9H1K5_9GAMM|nr:efflux RND transporter periplasmic adaptor subunit [Photobacterium proteolyticum]OLQ81458.1 efflux transporter periplasmic adaptor subunit [Photobacterium proteolyticum]
MKKILVAALVTAALSGGGFLYFQGESHAAEKKAAPGAGRFIPVTTGEVSSHPVAQSLSLIGKLEAQRSVNVATQVAAKVDSIVVGVNNKVAKGELLVQLDDAKARAAYEEALAYLNDEKRKLNEFKSLVKRGAITQTEIDAQQASVNIADARLKAAKAELDDHAIHAPFAGTVGLIDISPGYMLTVGSELFSLDDLSSMRLDIQVPEQYLSFMSEGMSVTATSQAWPGREFMGEIQAIDSRVQADSLNIKVRVNFDNSDNKLKPGMLMAATIGFTPHDAAIIPVQALEYSGTKRFVYLVDEQNIARRTEVTLGARVENEVVIESGISIGDRIVVQGLVNMRDGSRVNDLTAKKPLKSGDSA